MTIGIIGTFDTKGIEFAYLQGRIRAHGADTLTVDCGTGGDPVFPPDVPAAEVAQAAGTALETLWKRGDRGEAVAAMARGAAVMAARLFAEGRLHGLISLGGSAGTTIGTAAMRTLPVGVPKLMVSTLASGDTRPYVDTKDICMMYSVVDIAGLNRVSTAILDNAAGAIVGMCRAPTGLDSGPGTRDSGPAQRPLVAATMFGVTTPCVTRARELLEAAGCEVLVFHATGTGGRAMEDLVRSGFISAVLDVTTTELADELVGGVLSAGPDRLEAAGAAGVPQVVCPGAIDMVNFGPPDTVPQRFRARTFYHHNPTVTLMRTTPEECAELGRITARKLSAARGPVTVAVPLQGVSAIDREGQPFHDPAALTAYVAALKAGLGPQVKLMELDAHVNDPVFAEGVASEIIHALRSLSAPTG